MKNFAVGCDPAAAPNLTTQQWQELTRIIDAIAAQSHLRGLEEERRIAKRSRFVFPVRITWTHESHIGSGSWAMAHNISRSGMGMLARRMFRKGERVVVELPSPDGAVRRFEAIVVFCRYVSDMYHDLGVSFIGPADAPN